MSRTPNKPVTRARLTDTVVAQLLAVLSNNLEAFEVARPGLRWQFVDTFDPAFGLWLRVLYSYYDEHQALPSFDVMHVEIQHALNTWPNLLNADQIKHLNENIEWAYDPSSFSRPLTDPSMTSWAISRVKQFMEEQLVDDFRSSIYEDSGAMPSDLPGLIENFQLQSDAIRSVSGNSSFMLFPDDWDRRVKVNATTTGLPFLDCFMDGGHAPGEVYGVLGPYGSCKTTMAVQLAVEAAIRFHGEASCEGYDGKPKIAFIVSYEEAGDDMRNRVLGCAARIARSSISNMNSKEDLSRSDNLLPYERRLFAKKLENGEPVEGEYERAERYLRILNQHLVVLELTGNAPEAKGAGGGWTGEIKAMISAVLRNRNAKCGLVIVDYVGAMIEQHIAANNLPDDQRRILIKRTPIRMRHDVAGTFKCPVWLMHQLSGEANSKAIKSPAAAIDHTESAECKAFGENLVFAIVVGMPNTDGMTVIACTKYRRARRMEPRVILLDGAMYCIKDTNGAYVVDTDSRKIVRADDYANRPTLESLTAAAAAPAAARRHNTDVLDSGVEVPAGEGVDTVVDEETVDPELVQTVDEFPE